MPSKSSKRIKVNRKVQWLLVAIFLSSIGVYAIYNLNITFDGDKVSILTKENTILQTEIVGLTKQKDNAESQVNRLKTYYEEQKVDLEKAWFQIEVLIGNINNLRKKLQETIEEYERKISGLLEVVNE